MPVSNTRLAKASGLSKNSKFTVEDFKIIPKTDGRLKIGIPVGLAVE